jgi:crystallin alpha B
VWGFEPSPGREPNEIPKVIDLLLFQMSVVPLVFGDLFDELRRPVSLFDQNFGMGMLADDLLDPSIVTPHRVGYYRPWRSHAARHSGVSHIQNDKDGFRVSIC